MRREHLTHRERRLSWAGSFRRFLQCCQKPIEKLSVLRLFATELHQERRGPLRPQGSQRQSIPPLDVLVLWALAQGAFERSQDVFSVACRRYLGRTGGRRQDAAQRCGDAGRGCPKGHHGLKLKAGIGALQPIWAACSLEVTQRA